MRIVRKVIGYLIAAAGFVVHWAGLGIIKVGEWVADEEFPRA